MIIEKGKVYGYSYEELQAMGKSYKDVWGDIEVDNKDLELSVWDILDMFRNQYLIIRVTQCEDRDQIFFVLIMVVSTTIIAMGIRCMIKLRS